MNAEVFYFSATGNSLVVARDIAEKIDGKLTPIPSVMDQETIETEADVIGIVFPAYYTHMPSIVERFIAKLPDMRSKYVFAIVTVGGIAGEILHSFSTEIGKRNGTLSGGFIVRMPPNYIHNSDALPLFLQNRMFRKWENRADNIADYILNKKKSRMETFNPVMTFLFSKNLEKRYQQGALRPDIDKNFRVDEKCKGCGTCAKVCPVGNIEMTDGIPVWQHHCVKCLACIQWCPNTAIQYGDVTEKRKRYHHPNVKLSDMLKQRSRSK